MRRFFRRISNIHNIQIKTIKHNFGTAKSYRLLHFSDFHIGNFSVNDVRRIVRMINEIDVDFVVFTGDVVCNRHAELTPEILDVLSNIKHTVYAILGNHDYDLYTKSSKRDKVNSFRAVLRKMSEIGWIYLINENTTFEELQLIGTDDKGNDRWSLNRGNIDKAMKNRIEGLPNIVLTHNPTYVDEIVDKYKPELILCGHTHAGQLGWDFSIFGRRFTWSLAANMKYWLDSYNVRGTFVHVNRGIGYDMVPIRTFLPELTVHEIKSS